MLKLWLIAGFAVIVLGLFVQNSRLERALGAQNEALNAMRSGLNSIAKDAKDAAESSSRIAAKKAERIESTRTIIREVEAAPVSTACIDSAAYNAYASARLREQTESPLDPLLPDAPKLVLPVRPGAEIRAREPRLRRVSATGRRATCGRILPRCGRRSAKAYGAA